MKVLFVYPNITGHESPHQGLMSLSGFLRFHGHETALIDFTFGASRSSMLANALRFEPDLIGFTSTSGMFKAAMQLARALKKEMPATPIVFGGPHPTVSPQTVMKEQSVDIVCINEGEEALKDLLDRMAAGDKYFDIEGLWVKQDGTVHKNKVRRLIEDLDTLPFPDYGLFDVERYLQAKNGVFDVITGRGCPYPCSYCINHEIQQIQGQKGKQYMRKHSVDYVMRLLKSVREKYEVTFIAFEDDLFTMYRDWLEEFCKSFKSEFHDLFFSCNHRVELADHDIFGMLSDAGCVNLHMGIEAGNEHVRKTILRRNVSNEKILRAFELAQAAGIGTTSYNILGSPHETLEHMEETIFLNQKIKPDHIGVSIFCPYPGTQLYTRCIEEGLIEPDFEVPNQHRSQVVLKYDPEFKRKIKHLKKTFRYRVYKEYNYKKAVIFLLFDITYDIFIAWRNRIPQRLKRIMFLLYHQLIKHKGETAPSGRGFNSFNDEKAASMTLNRREDR